MDDDLYTFEERLRAITPAAPSDAARERLASQLGRQPSALRPYVLGLTGLAAAACVGLGAWVWLGGTPGESSESPGRITEGPADSQDLARGMPRPAPESAGVDDADTPAGALLAYHRIMRGSPESLIFMVDHQAVFGGTTGQRQADRPRPLRAMDARMFLQEDERCDG